MSLEFLVACLLYLGIGLVLASFAGADLGGVPAALATAAVVGPIYFLPTLRAHWRHATNVNAVCLYNLLIGWTVIGWIIAYAWVPKWPPPQVVAAPQRQPCPHCAEAILPQAKVCRYCGSALRPGWAAGAEIVTLPRAG